MQLLNHVGLGYQGSHTTLITIIGSGNAQSAIDCYGWPEDRRTLFNAHKHIDENWHSLTTGDVIDIEYILKETEVAKTTEFIDLIKMLEEDTQDA